jgi:membrane-associated phospholipid phosphatase
MFGFEVLAIGFFAALVVAVPLTGGAAKQKRVALLLSASLVALILVLAQTASADVRGWVAHAYLVSGYWIPALLVPNVGATRFEAWLIRTDTVWRRHAGALPRWAAPILELAYLLCYPAVPVSFAMVWTRGDLADVDRFWLAVLASGFASYGCLPWLVSRPPRFVVDTPLPPSPVAGLNALVLGRVSHQLNTFPSGHAAVSVAAALSVLSVSTPGGIVMMVIAVGIALGAVAGRYHYALDVLIGVVIGVLSSLVVWRITF